ncbi:MAG: hypothetical protein QNK19_14275 [Xanthomonadales bacterium]|nr:hypothetical protein [Xanthomonadales bacterium]
MSASVIRERERMKIIGAAVVLFVGYFVWRFVVGGDALVFIRSDSGQKVVANVKRVILEQEILLDIKYRRGKLYYRVSISRQLVNRLGLSEPTGFVV